jgi:hypothetical protein
MLRGEAVMQEGDEFRELLGEVVALHGIRGGIAITAQRGRLDGAATWCTANAEVDAVWIERVQGTEGLGHLQRRVMRQHDTARSEANAGGFRSDACQHDLGRTAGKQLHCVMLRHPEALVAQGLDMLGKLD